MPHSKKTSSDVKKKFFSFLLKNKNFFIFQLSTSVSSLSSSSSSKHSALTISSNDVKNRIKGLFTRHSPVGDPSVVSPVVTCKRFPKVPILFHSVRKQPLNNFARNILFIFYLETSRNAKNCD
jgi:CRISPR/Cas system-associated protein endoribonuclease Cas2